MGPKPKNVCMLRFEQGQRAAQGEDLAAPERETMAELLQPLTYSPPRSRGISESAPPPATNPATVTTTSNIFEGPEEPKIYYPKEKKGTDREPDSAPLLPRWDSFSEVLGEPSRAVRKVSSTPRLQGEEYGGNRRAAQPNFTPESSVGSAETPQEDYCQALPKLEGIILGSPDLSLTNKGTCGTRGSGKLVLPERRIPSAQGSVEMADVEFVCGSSSTVTPRRTSSENNTEVLLPGQNVHASLPQLPLRPPTPVEFRQRPQSREVSSYSSFVPDGRSTSISSGVKISSSSSARSNKSRGQGPPFFVQPSIHSHHDHYMELETSPGEDSNVVEQSTPRDDSPKTVPQDLRVEGTAQNEILSQLKALAGDVAAIKIEQIRISKKLEDTNNHLKAFWGKPQQLESEEGIRSFASYEESITNHVTQGAGEFNEAVESVAISLAKIGDNTANTISANPAARESDDLKWSDAVEQGSHDTTAGIPITTYITPVDQGRPSIVQGTGRMGENDVGKENVGGPMGRRRSQTSPSVRGDTAQDQGQQQFSNWHGPPTSQKRGFWKRHNGGMSRRGSASGSGSRKCENLQGIRFALRKKLLTCHTVATPNSTGQQQPVSAASQVYTHGGYEAQSQIQPSSRNPGTHGAHAHASGQYRGYPHRQFSMRHNQTSTRDGAMPSNRSYMPHRDFSPNYGSPPGHPGQGYSQVGFHRFHGAQNVGSSPEIGQWPAANTEFNVHRPWAGVSNWYHQVNPQGNNDMQGPPN
ncbi:predicted protein [Histoplasma capsulatum G186AR]|uniref:Uncharacterized protein n=1 Tax=Ajellomyces capsulatus (strain G186AR / H82 / ATCC MYA-2454 / RMSCC 2432) TaxID=447093 RepID=C0NW87_AJECG|nr:uncharacterized protein HCBG_07417 [Histoplasma capsulatum G186AR]EEH04192.1 predicted protein [Histoplasma capsulatum G186AR]